MIKFENVSKQYPDGTKAVSSLNLEIKEGEFLCIIGPSGCGKTTTLKMINRLVPLSEGAIRINEKNINDYEIFELRWNIGYVLQQIALFPHMTIEENIAIVPELRNWSRKKIQQRVSELLEMVGLDADTYRYRMPNELSGGQQQRIGVIRALAADPGIILMDEPFSALDPINRENLQNELLELKKKIKKTIVFVTHDMKEALKLGDRICVMKDGEMVQVGTPNEILENPSNDFVKNFIGNIETQFNKDMNIEEFVLQSAGDDDKLMTVNTTASLNELLEILSTQDKIAVEKNGEIIGTINRQRVIQILSNRLKEGERENG